jgi:hypothetical protein
MASKQPTIADAIRELMMAEDAGKGPHPDFADLVAHYFGRVSGQEAERIQAHLDHCSFCKEQILELAQWETDESPPASDQEVEEVWARLKADPEIVMPAAAPPSWFRQLRKQHIEKIAAGLLIATLASTAALISTLVKVGRLQSGEVNVPVASISKGYKGPVESGTADRPVEVLPGAVLIFTPADVPEEIPYEVQITRRDGHVVWTGQGLKPSPKGSFHLRLPRDLSPGTYRLRIIPGEGREIVVRVAKREPG